MIIKGWKVFYQIHDITYICLMKLKKLAIIITLNILIFTFNSGCLSNKEVSFNINSKSILDYNGFPSLKLNYTSNDAIIVHFIDPDEKIIFSDSFYPSQSEIIISLASYRNTSKPGFYILYVYDTAENPIYNETFYFKGSNLSIFSVDEYWWEEKEKDSKYSLIGITLNVMNNGDLPIYPYSLDLSIENKSNSADIIPIVILPGETGYVNCSLFISDLNTYEKNCHISLFDQQGETLKDFTFQTIPQQNVPTYHFDWNFNGIKEINIPYPLFLLDYYQKHERLNTNDYAAYVFDPYDDLFITLLTNSITANVEDMDNISKINLIASFIQNLEYGEDDPFNSSYEYPLFPIELLNNISCDCEDRSILLGNMLMLMGYNISLISLPKHMAIGVHLDQNLSDYECYIDKYYYLETVKENMVIGEVPTLYQKISEEAIVYPLIPRSIISHEWKNADGIIFDEKLDFVKLKLFIENIGNALAEKITISAAFYSSDNTEYHLEKRDISSLLPGEKKQVFLKVKAPEYVSAILKTKLFLDDVLIEEKQSVNIFT